MPVVVNICITVCRGTFHGVQNKHGPYVPFWIDTPSLGHHWAELGEALPPESEVCGHRAWPLACVHTDRGTKKQKKKREGTQRDGVVLRETFRQGESQRENSSTLVTGMDELLAKIGYGLPLTDMNINCWASASFHPTSNVWHACVRLKTAGGGGQNTIGPVGWHTGKRLRGFLGNVAPRLNRA